MPYVQEVEQKTMHSPIVWHWLPRHWLPLAMPAFSSVTLSWCPRFPVTRRAAPHLLYSRRRQFVHIYKLISKAIGWLQVL